MCTPVFGVISVHVFFVALLVLLLVFGYVFLVLFQPDPSACVVLFFVFVWH